MTRNYQIISLHQLGDETRRRIIQAGVANDDDVLPLLVTPKVSGKLLGIGKTKTFQLLAKGILERRYVDGAVRVTLRSVLQVAGL